MKHQSNHLAIKQLWPIEYSVWIPHHVKNLNLIGIMEWDQYVYTAIFNAGQRLIQSRFRWAKLYGDGRERPVWLCVLMKGRKGKEISSHLGKWGCLHRSVNVSLGWFLEKPRKICCLHTMQSPCFANMRPTHSAICNAKLYNKADG